MSGYYSNVTTQIRRNDERERYELDVDGRVIGIAEYHRDGDVVIFPHTEVVISLRGQGYGEQLVRAALDDVRAGDDKIVPACRFVRDFVRDNPEYKDLVA